MTSHILHLLFAPLTYIPLEYNFLAQVDWEAKGKVSLASTTLVYICVKYITLVFPNVLVDFTATPSTKQNGIFSLLFSNANSEFEVRKNATKLDVLLTNQVIVVPWKFQQMSIKYVTNFEIFVSTNET